MIDSLQVVFDSEDAVIVYDEQREQSCHKSILLAGVRIKVRDQDAEGEREPSISDIRSLYRQVTRFSMRGRERMSRLDS